MDRHPIESLMGTTMENIRDMVDVNTVVGDPVQTADGVTVIPISRVSFGFVAGGGEYSAAMQPPARVAPAGAAEEEKLPLEEKPVKLAVEEFAAGKYKMTNSPDL